MRNTAITAGLIGSATVAALLAPAASGATPQGVAAARPAVQPATTTSLPTTARPYVVIPTAPIGTAGPAAPAPIVVVATKSVPVKPSPAAAFAGNKYWDERAFAEQTAWQGALLSGGQGVAYGALAGGIIGGLAGGLIGVISLSVPGMIIGVVVGALIGAGIGAVIGGTVGTITGAINGYNDGLGEARFHNRKLRQYYRSGGQHPAAQPTTVARRASAVQPIAPVVIPRQVAGIPVPKEAAAAINDAQRALNNVLGVPTPKRRR
ncbi:MAG: hypothetical protein QM728_14325 [Gordonia sp. (in: high G+C Gram-positive bacteria)]|uniref:hypothetical protein n=1 Tax=Gordonia sp. (in: high G+C Gram-positive bacteria) TaxID=84139 RepID=UPI0039E6AEFD